MNSLVMAALASNVGIEAAREGARMAGQFSPINTAILTVAVALLGMILKNQLANRKLTTEVNGELRQEFIDEMKGLREDNKHLREQVTKLSTEVFQLHGIINAMRQASISADNMIARAVVAGDAPMERALSTLDGIRGTGE